MENHYTGNEQLKINGNLLPYNMLKFWQLSMSDIKNHLNRGTFAEYIVRCALVDNGFDAFQEDNGSIRTYDISGPSVPGCSNPSRIEIKSTARLQYSSQGNIPRLVTKDSGLVFGIQPHKSSSARDNDLYVFCLYNAESPDADILDLDLWEFYVLPTFKINADAVLKNQKTISLYRLKQLGVQPQTFDTLYQEIFRVLGEYSNNSN